MDIVTSNKPSPFVPPWFGMGWWMGVMIHAHHSGLMYDRLGSCCKVFEHVSSGGVCERREGQVNEGPPLLQDIIFHPHVKGAEWRQGL